MTGHAVTSPRVEADPGNAVWPAEGLERVPACPVCGGNRRSLAYPDLTDNVAFCAPGAWAMHRCLGCGSYYLDPRPDPATIHLAYARYFTHAAPRGAARREPPGGLATLRRSLANGYRNWRFGTQARPATVLGIGLALLIPRLRRTADSRMRFIPRAAAGRRLLDVGAGNGDYLLQARSAGWDVVGVEPDPAAVATARRAGLDVRQGGIEALSGEPESLDVITMNHVIEHVHDPRRVLGDAFKLLRSGGLLFLETPNVDSAGHRRFGRHWRGLEPPRHLVLFNWDSLERLLEAVGFGGIRRIPRAGVYPTLAVKSRAIRRGADPENIGRAPRLQRVGDTLRELGTMSNHRRREFITLLAVKR